VKTCTGKECAELLSLLASPDGGRQRYWFQIDEIEMEFLQENSAWEFSHSLGQKAKYSL
jgi:hypothetical protein